MNAKIVLKSLPLGQIEKLRASVARLNYPLRKADEKALGILLGLRFTGNAPEEAVRKLEEITCRARREEAIATQEEKGKPQERSFQAPRRWRNSATFQGKARPGSLREGKGAAGQTNFSREKAGSEGKEK